MEVVVVRRKPLLALLLLLLWGPYADEEELGNEYAAVRVGRDVEAVGVVLLLFNEPAPPSNC